MVMGWGRVSTRDLPPFFKPRFGGTVIWHLQQAHSFCTKAGGRAQ